MRPWPEQREKEMPAPGCDPSSLSSASEVLVGGIVFHPEGVLAHDHPIGIPLPSHDQEGKRMVPVAGDALSAVSGVQLKELKDRGVPEFIPRASHRPAV